MSRAATASVTSRMRSASVDLPWSMCAMIEKLRILPWSMNRTGYSADSHQPVRPPLLLDLPHVAEPCFLEGAPGARVLVVDRGHTRGDRNALVDERAQDLRAEAAADQLLLADQQIDSGHALADLDDRLPLRVVAAEICLDHPDVSAVDD